MLIELYPISKFYEIIENSGKIHSLSINRLIHAIYDDDELLTLINQGELVDKINRYQRDIDIANEQKDHPFANASRSQLYIDYCEAIMLLMISGDLPDQFIVSRGVIINGAY
jgi:hypothetical protein